MTAVVRERDRLDERQTEVRGARDSGGDLRDLDRVGQAGAEMVVLGRDEHLALAREAPPRARVLDPVEVTLEAQAVGVGLLGSGAVARAERTRRARREQHVERRLPLFAGQQSPADERRRTLVRPPNDNLGGFIARFVSLSATHGAMKPRG